MQSHIDDQACECRCCDQPMKLIRGLPKMSLASELLVFYCRDCNEVDSANWRLIPPAQCVALH
jgi:hypothetical protein